MGLLARVLPDRLPPLSLTQAPPASSRQNAQTTCWLHVPALSPHCRQGPPASATANDRTHIPAVKEMIPHLGSAVAGPDLGEDSDGDTSPHSMLAD